MGDRARRRRLSFRYAARAQREHLSVAHPSGVIDCVCERSVWLFRKRKALGCGCRKRKRGNPKVAAGICCGRGYREAVVARIGGKRLERAWLVELTRTEDSWSVDL